MKKDKLQQLIKESKDPVVNHIELEDRIRRGVFGDVYDIGYDKVLKVLDPGARARAYGEQCAVELKDELFAIMLEEAELNQKLWDGISSDYLLLADKYFVIEEYVGDECVDRVVCLKMQKVKRNLIKYAKCFKMDEEVLLKIARDVANGMCDYKTKTIYGDISPANLFFSSLEQDGTPRFVLGNFGVIKAANDGSGVCPTREFDAEFASPEQRNVNGLKEVVLDIRADIYSLGKSLLYFTTSRENSGLGDVQSKVKCSQKFLDLLKQMTAEEKEERIQTPEELLERIEELQKNLHLRKEEEDADYIQKHQQKIKDLHEQYHEKMENAEICGMRYYEGKYKQELLNKDCEIEKIKKKENKSKTEVKDSTSRIWIIMMLSKFVFIAVALQLILAQITLKVTEVPMFEAVLPWVCTSDGEMITHVLQLGWVRYGLGGLLLVCLIVAVVVPCFYKTRLSYALTGIMDALLAFLTSYYMLIFTDVIYEQTLKSYLYGVIGSLFFTCAVLGMIATVDNLGTKFLANCWNVLPTDIMDTHHKMNICVSFWVCVLVNFVLPFMIYGGTDGLVIRVVITLVIEAILIGLFRVATRD